MAVTRPRCPNCDGKDFGWGVNVWPNAHAPQDGLLKLNEVHALAYLYCVFCSETIAQLDEEAIADALSTQAPAWYARKFPEAFQLPHYGEPK